LNLGLGIDAGGTYTDAVLVDLDGREVLAKGKALTTKGDYTLGVCRAIDALDLKDPGKISMVALSTTLATNAIVENKGGRVGLVLIGYPREIAGMLPREAKWAMVRGVHSIRGEELEPLDVEDLRLKISELAPEVDVFAISSYLGVRNSAHEAAAREMAEETGLPCVCGHELTSELNSVERALTVFFNARLIPLIVGLIESVERALRARGIHAPMNVVKSDGCLMGRDMAMQRPIDTMYSGPVASVGGARWLTGIKDALVLDMGGTTTDIARLVGGRPKGSEGVSLDKYRLAVGTLDIKTSGLGGDSEIKLNGRGGFAIGPERVVPISYVAWREPQIKDELKAWVEGRDLHVDAGLLPPIAVYTFLEGNQKNGSLSSLEEKVLGLLQGGSASVFQIAARLDYPYPSLLSFRGLEERGLIHRVGLTPTDVLSGAGLLDLWDGEAARLAIRLYARRLGMKADDFILAVRKELTQRLASVLVGAALEEETRGGGWETPLCQHLLKKSLFGGKGAVRVSVGLDLPLIGVGAPVAAYLPDVAKGLGCELVLPEHHEVANAVGAVIGQISFKSEAVIRSLETGGVAVYGPGQRKTFKHRSQALKAAQEMVGNDAREKAAMAGGEDVEVFVRVDDRYANISADSPGAFLVETRVVAEAVGRPPARSIR
jgi:N-methylhydantoinase A/oxoprolinase/acetone carboxylase beta subunit